MIKLHTDKISTISILLVQAISVWDTHICLYNWKTPYRQDIRPSELKFNGPIKVNKCFAINMENMRCALIVLTEKSLNKWDQEVWKEIGFVALAIKLGPNNSMWT